MTDHKHRHISFVHFFLRLLKNPINIFLAVIVIINALLIGVLWYTPSKSQDKNSFPELIVLSKKDMRLKQLQDYFVAISEKKGAVYAYDLMKVAPFPDGIDLHLLGHTVGEELYKQKGLDGMVLCGHEFRNACSHTIVVGEFQKNGESSLGKINEVCKKAPGGKGAYAMCYHGLGHGIFAYTGYDVAETVRICQKTDTNTSGREFVECVGGMIMELVGGGDHDRELWKEQSVKYLSKTDPLSPCNTDLIPTRAKGMCYIYLTPYLFQVSGARVSNPSDENLAKSFNLCEQIPSSEKENTGICYAGFGKEFVVLAKKRDIRNIDKMTPAEMNQVIKWCFLAGEPANIKSCISGAINSIYWGGENPVEPAIDFCKILTNDYQDRCFSTLNIAVKAYSRNDDEYKKFCDSIPSQHQQLCKNPE